MPTPLLPHNSPPTGAWALHPTFEQGQLWWVTATALSAAATTIGVYDGDLLSAPVWQGLVAASGCEHWLFDPRPISLSRGLVLAGDREATVRWGYR